MSIKDTLQKDLIVSLKARNKLATSSLRAIIGAVNLEEKGGKSAVVFSDDQVLTVITRQVKQRRESAQIYADAGATERAAQETAEADFLTQYLPAQLTEDEVKKIVFNVINSFDTRPTQSDFGSIMKQVTAETKGKADGKLVSSLVKASIS